MGKWIWIRQTDAEFKENTRGCFAASFCVDDLQEDVTLTICAVEKYMVYLNGKMVGRGPIRHRKGELAYDSYALLPQCREGENHLAIRVWNYGWSSYQSTTENPALDFAVVQSGKILAESGEDTKCRMDEGHMRYVPKRNVNHGFTDYYDGRKDNLKWISDSRITENWENADVLEHVADNWTLTTRPIRSFDAKDIYPKKVDSIQDVERGCYQLTLNTRRAFFGDRRDADETIFAAFIGGHFVMPREMDGMISFPNRTWNGLIGSFRLGDQIYHVDNAHRDIPVHVKAGEQFFLLQISGKFDDLYCHMELKFPEKPVGKGFFTVGPTEQIVQTLDGVSRIYGGLDEFNEMESYTEEHKHIWESKNFEELLERAGEVHYLDEKDIYEDLYVLSLARTEKIVQEYAVQVKDCGILWNNQNSTVIELPKVGDYRRIVVDFGNVYVGHPTFTLKASEGTVIDIYGFENYYGKEIDYTIGLNNAIHYVASEGWQTYQCMARFGMRYALITVRNAKTPLEIRDFHMRHETYSVPALGQFECSDAKLNRIFEMCRDTNRLCTEDSFTDSPTWEQAFWTGDAQLSSLIHAWVFGDYDFCRHVHKLAVTAQDNAMVMNAITPTDWNTSIPMWMMNWVVSIFETAEFSGSAAHVEELYPYMYGVLNYYRQFITEEGGFLINAWNMIDWAAMDIGNHGVITAHQAELAYCYRIFGDYCAGTGREAEAEIFRGESVRLLKYIDAHMWDEKRKVYLDGWTPENGISKTISIQTHIMLYLFDGILGEEKKTLVEGYLINPPDDFLKVGSPFILYYLYQAYMNAGHKDMVFADVKERWGEMLRYDSTTCWEVFPGFYENGRTRSYCHSWSATPAYFMIRYLSGVTMLEKGFGKITFEECPIALDWCRSSVPTPYGMVTAEWTCEDGKYDVFLEIPEEIEFVECENENVKIRIKTLKRG